PYTTLFRSELLRDDRRQRPEHDPDHERDVEIEERGQQGGIVARLPETPGGGWGRTHRRAFRWRTTRKSRHDMAPGTRSGGFVATQISSCSRRLASYAGSTSLALS